MKSHTRTAAFTELMRNPKECSFAGTSGKEGESIEWWARLHCSSDQKVEKLRTLAPRPMNTEGF